MLACLSKHAALWISTSKHFSEGIKPMSAVFPRDGREVPQRHEREDGEDEVRAGLTVSARTRSPSRRRRTPPTGSRSFGRHRLSIFIEKIRSAYINLEAFEAATEANDKHDRAVDTVYGYAAPTEGVPSANGAPNLTCDIPAMVELANHMGVPIGGRTSRRAKR